MKILIKVTFVASACLMMSGCAALGSSKTLKAPCGPTAGMTDPCGNRAPINKGKPADLAQAFELQTVSL